MAAVNLEAKGAAALLPTRPAQIAEIFALIDSDKSGSIELKELKAMVRMVKPDAKDEEIKKQFAALDKSHDGKVSKEEFSKYYMEHFASDDDKKFFERMQHTKKYLTRKPKLASVFDSFDADKNGFLSRGEIFRMVRLSKPKFTNDDLTALFNKIDMNHDHKVDKAEFILYYFNLFFNETDAEFEERVEEAFQGRRKVKLQMLFNMYDLDGDGFLDLNEFSAMLKLNGRKFVSADVILDTLIKVDKHHNRKVSFEDWMDYISHLTAHMDDTYFNKAINNMIQAAHEVRAKATASTTATGSAAAAPAVGSAAAGASFHQPGHHGHGHGHSHK